jgi:hypothetical protein
MADAGDLREQLRFHLRYSGPCDGCAHCTPIREALHAATCKHCDCAHAGTTPGFVAGDCECARIGGPWIQPREHEYEPHGVP